MGDFWQQLSEPVPLAIEIDNGAKYTYFPGIQWEEH